jgi:hypothetical protein
MSAFRAKRTVADTASQNRLSARELGAVWQRDELGRVAGDKREAP